MASFGSTNRSRPGCTDPAALNPDRRLAVLWLGLVLLLCLPAPSRANAPSQAQELFSVQVASFSTLDAALTEYQRLRQRLQPAEAELLREIDVQSERVAANASDELRQLVARSAQAPLVGTVFGRLRGDVVGCPTRRAVAVLEPLASQQGREVRELYTLQFRRLAQLRKIRGFVRLKAWTDVWLLFHVPLSCALFGALTAHIIAVFFYW